MIENSTPLSPDELAQHRRQDAFYMASSLCGGAHQPTVEDVINDAKQIEAYLNGQPEDTE